MVRLAVAGLDGLEASDLEICRDGPSFTSHTLRALLGSGLPRDSLHFIIGTDAFAEIATWHDYPAVVDLAHFVVIARPGHDFGALSRRLPDLASRMRVIADRPRRPAIARSQEPAREDLLRNRPDTPDGSEPTIWLVESATPDISSTQIRERLRDGRPLSGLVPPLVERYLRRHGLYQAAPESHGGRGHEGTLA
jgi:nicotinate-nucleotide adenylyltransferase